MMCRGLVPRLLLQSQPVGVACCKLSGRAQRPRAPRTWPTATCTGHFLTNSEAVASLCRAYSTDILLIQFLDDAHTRRRRLRLRTGRRSLQACRFYHRTRATWCCLWNTTIHTYSRIHTI